MKENNFARKGLLIFVLALIPFLFFTLIPNILYELLNPEITFRSSLYIYAETISSFIGGFVFAYGIYKSTKEDFKNIIPGIIIGILLLTPTYLSFFHNFIYLKSKLPVTGLCLGIYVSIIINQFRQARK